MQVALVTFTANSDANASFTRLKKDLIDDNIFDITEYSYPTGCSNYTFEGSVDKAASILNIIVNDTVKSVASINKGKFIFSIALNRGMNKIGLFTEAEKKVIHIGCWNFNILLWMYSIEFAKVIQQLEIYRANTFIDRMDDEGLKDTGSMVAVKRPISDDATIEDLSDTIEDQGTEAIEDSWSTEYNRAMYRKLIKDCTNAYEVGATIAAIKAIFAAYKIALDIKKRKSKLRFRKSLLIVTAIANGLPTAVAVGDDWVFTQYGWKYLPKITKSIITSYDHKYYFYAKDITDTYAEVDWEVLTTYDSSKYLIAVLDISTTGTIKLIDNTIGSSFDDVTDSTLRDVFYGFSSKEAQFRYYGYCEIPEGKKNSIFNVLDNSRLAQTELVFVDNSGKVII